MVRILPYDEDPKIQAMIEEGFARKDFNEKNNILTTPLRAEKKFYDTVLEIYNKEIGDNNLYVSKNTYDMDGALMLNEYSIKYKEWNENISKFHEIREALEQKEIINKYKENDKINLYIKIKDINDEWIGHENITGKLIQKNEKCIEVKSDKNGDILTIKYIDILLVDEDDDEYNI